MSVSENKAEELRAEERIDLYRQKNPAADRWAAGYGPIQHTVETQGRVFAMADQLAAGGVAGDGVPLFDLLHAADRITSATMWLVVHETYARNVYLDGRDLSADDFKPDPQGHTGGSLNMVPAYIGYMTANALTALTRSWIMGQGHCVSAIDSANLLLGNALPVHEKRYPLTDEGLTRYVRDFYSYRLTNDGAQESPLGSHVNPNTAGGLIEGGYLGFAELQYVHMPLPGERLVVFLSDGAWEEQRGSDWAPRWWRANDSGYVTPIMIANGRRIDQRTTLRQEGGVEWFKRHLKLNSFAPFSFDGRDPAAFAWAVYESESRLEAITRALSGGDDYPIALPYGIAVAPKGAGFYGEGTNLAHNLPLGGNPHEDSTAAAYFNESSRRLWVPPDELGKAGEAFNHHHKSSRPRERNHALTRRDVSLQKLPEGRYRAVPEKRLDMSSWTRSSPMRAVDITFVDIVEANPQLRPRVGNPDEMRSNRMQKTLDTLKFRVTAPESGIPEDIHGKVVTALNEEAICSAALANKGGINIVVTYEAFGAKMQGKIRQEIIWANHCKEKGRPQKWLSVPVVLTSHVWENGKNEQSHQDPSLAEVFLNEPSDVSRVLFVADHNTAVETLHAVYQTQGQIFTLVVSKADSSIPDLFTPEEAARLVEQGALRLEWAGHETDDQEIILTAVGAYQLEETLRASTRLAERGVPHSVVYMIEPGKFRTPRSDGEQEHIASPALFEDLYPESVPSRIFVTHTRQEPLLGVLWPLNTGYGRTAGLGFMNHGGTLNVGGMLFINRSTWAHVLDRTARITGRDRNDLLTEDELKALDGNANPQGMIIPPPAA